MSQSYDPFDALADAAGVTRWAIGMAARYHFGRALTGITAESCAEAARTLQKFLAIPKSQQAAALIAVSSKHMLCKPSQDDHDDAMRERIKAWADQA